MFRSCTTAHNFSFKIYNNWREGCLCMPRTFTWKSFVVKSVMKASIRHEDGLPGAVLLEYFCWRIICAPKVEDNFGDSYLLYRLLKLPAAQTKNNNNLRAHQVCNALNIHLSSSCFAFEFNCITSRVEWAEGNETQVSATCTIYNRQMNNTGIFFFWKMCTSG